MGRCGCSPCDDDKKEGVKYCDSCGMPCDQCTCDEEEENKEETN